MSINGVKTEKLKLILANQPKCHFAFSGEWALKQTILEIHWYRRFARPFHQIVAIKTLISFLKQCLAAPWHRSRLRLGPFLYRKQPVATPGHQISIYLYFSASLASANNFYYSAKFVDVIIEYKNRVGGENPTNRGIRRALFQWN